ncbi:hypothetical protein [Chryseobacterium sp. OSA05B]|uniref:hypothetical protein n=1 Tax=Chryseobacterium sp. OSA05B TaxID=2862650 RepID=UPI001CBDEA79|nr:hypothetical protein [Chryseobacterium sp. OSA05B]
MKKIVMILLPSLLASCDPGYAIIIANRSANNIYLETDPPIESRFSMIKDSTYNSIISKKVLSSDVTNRYQLESDQKIRLFGNVGFPSQNFFPYKKIKIIKGSDTLKIDKNNLMQKISKGKKGFYYINIE